MATKIDENLKSRIKKFLNALQETEYEQIADDFNDWIGDAVRLLEEVIGEK